MCLRFGKRAACVKRLESTEIDSILVRIVPVTANRYLHTNTSYPGDTPLPSSSISRSGV